MPKPRRRTERREEGLSSELIVDEVIALLDEEGENGLTFRALATRLATGPGAIYWHIANKSELLAAASDVVVGRALADVGAHATPPKRIRNIAASVFETVDAHPWVGAQLSRTPWRSATLQIFERIGRQVQALGAPVGQRFTVASALVSYIIGVSVQNAAQGRELGPSASRAEFLEKESGRWEALDAHDYPFIRSVAGQLRRHDDRAEFLAGIDLMLAGVAAP